MNRLKAIHALRDYLEVLERETNNNPERLWDRIRKTAKKQRDKLRAGEAPSYPTWTGVDADACILAEPLHSLWRQYQMRNPKVKLYVKAQTHIPGVFARMDDGKCQVVFATRDELIESLTNAIPKETT